MKGRDTGRGHQSVGVGGAIAGGADARSGAAPLPGPASHLLPPRTWLRPSRPVPAPLFAPNRRRRRSDLDAWTRLWYRGEIPVAGRRRCRRRNGGGGSSGAGGEAGRLGDRERPLEGSGVSGSGRSLRGTSQAW
jgi:hypothetical protein